MAERNSTEVNKRIEHDNNLVKQIINEDLGINANIKKVIRIGKVINGNISKCRPLKVICKDSEDALDILRNRSKCKNNVKINNDLTLMQREKLKRVKTELIERKSNGEMNLTLKYIRGVPTITTANKPEQKN